MTEHDASLTFLSAQRREQLWAEHLKKGQIIRVDRTAEERLI